jgi:hypothetical protein
MGTVLVMAKAELPSTKSDTAAGVRKSPVLGEESLLSRLSGLCVGVQANSADSDGWLCLGLGRSSTLGELIPWFLLGCLEASSESGGGSNDRFLLQPRGFRQS